MIAAITDVLPPLLDTFDRLAWVQRHLYPPVAERLAGELTPATEALTPPLEALRAQPRPDDLDFMRDRLVEVAEQGLEIVGAFVDAARGGGEPFELYRALRRFARAQEALYPLAPALDPVSRWFLDDVRGDDDAQVTLMREGTLREDAPRIGVLHADNERGARGGFSLYVPESWDGARSLPLIVALHGGHGHGRDFVWTWLRDARSHEMLLLAPTSRQRTWALMGEDVDAAPLGQMFDAVAARYPVDRARVLLTGMSDGATYAYLHGLREGSPFTHLAPMCGVLHPAVLFGGAMERARGREVYLIHGALDWMFPVQTARLARDTLTEAGVKLVYREVADLSHTYPRDENRIVLDWLSGG
jgi:phospholipase/carboxylesterase